MHETEWSRLATELQEEAEKQTSKGDPDLLGDKKAVNFRIAERYLGITSRQREKLMAKGSLGVIGKGRNKMITTESLRHYLPPREKRN